jgi:hypothetical protein
LGPDQPGTVRLTPCPPAREKRACLLLVRPAGRIDLVVKVHYGPGKGNR